MVTKSDFQAVRELSEQYKPQRWGIVSGKESALIRSVLELPERNDIELVNIRNMAVMLYGQWSDKARHDGNSDRAEMLMDAMSAVAAVIDGEKWERGMEV